MESGSSDDACVQEAIVGIDLGTSNCCMAAWRNGEAEVILDEQGRRIIPNVVLYTEDCVMVGSEARHRAPLYPTNTISNILQLVGRRRVEVLHIISKLPYSIVEIHERLKIVVTQQNGRSLGLFPEEVVAIVLSHLKQQAESHLGQPVHRAVISHPHNFNLLQLQSLKTAAQLADLDVQLFSSTGLAAMTYANSHCKASTPNDLTLILVFDMGSSKVEASVVALDGTSCQVLGGSASYECSGECTTNTLVSHVVREVRDCHGITTPTNGKTLVLLKAACEKAKIELSGSSMVQVQLDQVFPGRIDSLKVTRDMFDGLCEDQFLTALEVTADALKNSSVHESDIDSVVLVGGASRSPQLQKLLQKKFHKPLKRTINADEAVAMGAAIVAANVRKSGAAGLTEVVSHSIGIETVEGNVFQMISKGQLIPARNETLFERGDGEILHPLVVKVYEGENSRTRGNAFIKEAVISKSSAANVSVALTLGINGQLDLSFTDNDTSTVLVNDADICRKLYSLEEMEFMKMRNQQVQQQLQRQRKAMDAVNELETYTISIKSEIEEGELTDEAAEKVLNKCKTVLDQVGAGVNVTEEWIKILQLELRHLYEQQKELNALKKVHLHADWAGG